MKIDLLLSENNIVTLKQELVNISKSSSTFATVSPSLHNDYDLVGSNKNLEKKESNSIYSY